MSEELKPVRCGCGGEAKVFDHEVRWEAGIPHIVVECQACGIITKWHNTEEEAIEAWNKVMGAKDINVPNKFATDINVENKIAKVSKGAYDLMRCECGMPVSSNFDYCPRCRARLEWK